MPDTPSTTYTFTVAAPDREAVGHIPVPFDPRTLFGRARPPVVVAINGHSYRSTIAIMGGTTFVPFRASNRAAAGAAPGDTIEVTLTLDTAPREVDLPADLATAIDVAGCRAAWDRLSYSHRREHVEAVEGAKKPETRARRIGVVIAKLGG